MSIVKPYTFIGGTKARANEVNDNFDRLYEQVNINITDIANAQTDITNLGIDKADVQGSSLQRFAVADATGDYDAINKQTLMGKISNSLDIISGLQISRDSNSPNDTIIVSKGSCYDNNREIILLLQNPLSKKNDNQIANARYYVYIIGDNIGNTIDILITPDSITPALPSGYNKYRQIGYFNTDNDNAISNIYNYGMKIDTPSPLAVLTSVYANGTSWYRVWSDGWIDQGGTAPKDTTVTFLKPFSNSNYSLVISYYRPNNETAEYVVNAKNYNNFRTKSNVGNADPCYWMASGY